MTRVRICIKLNSECNLLEEKIFKVGNSDVTFKPAMSKNLIATVFYNGADDINQLKRWMKNINLALCFEVEAQTMETGCEPIFPIFHYMSIHVHYMSTKYGRRPRHVCTRTPKQMKHNVRNSGGKERGHCWRPTGAQAP